MSRKLHGQAYKEGALSKIAQWFIKPLYKYRADGLSFKEHLNNLFHTKTRDIVDYIAIQNFNMPGKCRLSLDGMKTPIFADGIINTKVNTGIILTVRTDTTEPDIVDVQFNAGQGNKEQWFKLNKSEWWISQKYLKELPLAIKKRKEVVRSVRASKP